MRNLKQDDWIKAVMGSLDGIKRAEANPYLRSKILTRLEAKKNKVAPVRMISGIGLGLVLLVLLNFTGIWIHKKKKNLASENGPTTAEQIIADYDLGTKQMNY